jgi:hypothetical protein
LRNDPLPSQRIQLKPSNFPTLIGQELATNDVSRFNSDWLENYRPPTVRSTSIGSGCIISCP